MNDELTELKRHAAYLEFELKRVRETVENQFSKIEVLENRLLEQKQSATPLSFPTNNSQTKENILGFLKKHRPNSTYYLEKPDTGPLIGTPGLSCYALKGKTDLVIGIATFDHDTDKLNKIVAMVMQNQRRTRGFVPVFLTNNPDFTPFRAQKYIYEYLRTEQNMVTSLKDEKHCQFLQERFKFITEKWGISMMIDMSKEL